MAFSLDLSTLFKQHFGIDVNISKFEPPGNLIPFDPLPTVEGGFEMVNGLPVDRYSALGTPVFDYIKIKNSTYYNHEGKRRRVYDYEFPYECLIELNQPSIIEETFIVGRKGGSIKEQMGTDDWYITIRGLIINYETGNYPTEAVERFIKMISHPTELEVESPFLNMFGINQMVIFDRNIPQIEGALNYQPFTLMCKSNEPFYVEV